MEIATTSLKKENSACHTGCARQLLAVQLKEYLTFDSFLGRKLIAALGLLGGFVLALCGRTTRAFLLLSAIHRAAYSAWVSKVVEWWLRSRVRKDRADRKSLVPVCDEYLDNLSGIGVAAKFLENPVRLLGKRILVLKTPAKNEKGVLVIDYTFTLSLFAKKFDVARVAERYHIVLEPTWCGYCDLDILCYLKIDFPVFVQAPEPRDASFVRSLNSNLIPLPIAGNWWVDHRVCKPLPGVTKDADVVMVASWGTYKRHYKFFSALARLRTQGEKLKVILVGYPADYSLDDILRQARYYGVEDQLETYENLSPEEVNLQYNRAKVNLLWSRKEGFNRAIIEGMCAGVPCILREGHNYGYHYPYINPQTGCFSSERDLPQTLLRVIRNRDGFAPREWVLQNMSCLKATEDLQMAIRKVATAAGENWTHNLAVKVCYLNTMRYWNEEERSRFDADYAFLQSVALK